MIENPCMVCGACCDGGVDMDFAEQQVPPSFVALDWSEGGGHVFRKTRVKDGSGPARKQCAALVGTIGEQVRCEIYANRPRLCCIFPVGCPECNDARSDYGLDPV